MKKLVVLVLIVLMCSPAFAIKIDIDETKPVDQPTSDIDIIAPSKLKSKVTRHVYGLGHVADVTNGEITYLHQDRLGSTRLKTDENGEVVGEFKSLPFGQEIVNDDVRYSFATGKELDSSGLYYFGARYYDPDVGRFTSVDPVRDNHAYSYVNNNPMNYVDPTGMDDEAAIFINNVLEERVQHMEGVKEVQAYMGVGFDIAADLTGGTAADVYSLGGESLAGTKLSWWERAFGLIPVFGSLTSLRQVAKVRNINLRAGRILTNRDAMKIVGVDLPGEKAVLGDFVDYYDFHVNVGTIDRLTGDALSDLTTELAGRNVAGYTINPHAAARFWTRTTESGVDVGSDIGGSVRAAEIYLEGVLSTPKKRWKKVSSVDQGLDVWEVSLNRGMRVRVDKSTNRVVTIF